MVPPPFEPFFTAMAQGGATLLGLLFVAISIRHASSDDEFETDAEAVLADGSLLALGNGFGVCASALVPGLNVAFVVLPLGCLAVFWVTKVGMSLVRAGWKGSTQDRARTLVPTVIAMAAALFQLFIGARLFLTPGNPGALRGLAIAVLAYYGIGLLRSWSLIGGARRGLRSVLAPLRR
jgi:hypothetical protein